MQEKITPKNLISNDHSLPYNLTTNLSSLPEPVQLHLSRNKLYEKQISALSNKEIKILSGPEFYQGEMNSEGSPEGFGKVVRKDGSVLFCLFTNGKANGKGLYIFKDGAYYQGEFKQNKMSGLGKLIKDNMIYEGHFHENRFDGQGQLKVGKHFSFNGIFSEGKKKSGTLKWFQNEGDQQISEYQGSFDENEKFTGKGTLKNKYGEYEGNFKNGNKDGEGVFKFKVGLTYAGNYKEGVKHGKGTLFNFEKVNNKTTYAQRDQLISYRGQFCQGLPHGKGEVWDKTVNHFSSCEWVEGISKSKLVQ